MRMAKLNTYLVCLSLVCSSVVRAEDKKINEKRGILGGLIGSGLNYGYGLGSGITSGISLPGALSVTSGSAINYGINLPSGIGLGIGTGLKNGISLPSSINFSPRTNLQSLSLTSTGGSLSSGISSYSAAGLSEINLASASKLPSVVNLVSGGGQVAAPAPQIITVPVDRLVPVKISQAVPVPVDRAVPVTVNRAIAVPVDRPVAVTIDRPVAVGVPQPVSVPVQQPVPVPVPSPVPVNVINKVLVPVPQPYTVVKAIPVPVSSPQIPAEGLYPGISLINGLNLGSNAVAASSGLYSGGAVLGRHEVGSLYAGAYSPGISLLGAKAIYGK